MEGLNVKEEKYKIALSEVDDILFFTDESVKSQIPSSFLNFIRENKDINYISNINPYLEIEKQDISEEAKAIMALIYRSYIASEEEKIEYQEKDKIELDKIEEEKRKKYNIDNIFENNLQEDKLKSEDEKVEEEIFEKNDLVEIKKIGFIEKIINFLKNVFHKNK